MQPGATDRLWGPRNSRNTSGYICSMQSHDELRGRHTRVCWAAALGGARRGRHTDDWAESEATAARLLAEHPSNASVPAGAAAAAMPAAGPRHDLSLRLRMDCPSSKELGQCRPAHYGCCDAAPVTGCGDWTEGRSAACAVGTVVGKDLNPEHAEHWTSPQGCRRLDLQASRARSDACRSQVVGSRRPTGRRAPGLRHGACPRPTATREELNSPRKGPTCGGGHGRSVLVVDR